MILLSGGTDGGTTTHVMELAEILAAANPRPRLGQNYKLPVIYAGNNKAQDSIRETLGDISDLDIVDNIRPVLEKENIIANCLSGVSGAGRNATEKLLFCERNESACAYGLPKHRHLSEIEEQLSNAISEDIVLSFHPHLAPMNRGICSTISVLAQDGLNKSKISECWNDFYKGRKFIHILDDGEFPDVSHVAGTNRIDISVCEDKRTGRYTICSAEDNLIKGAGGQAVQAMNICQGYEEGEGLP